MKRVNSKSYKNKKNSKIIKLIFLFLLVLIIIAFIIVFNTIKVKNLKIELSSTENTKISEEIVKSLSKVNIGDNLFKQSSQEIIDNIKTNNFVDSVQVTKKLNGNVYVNVNVRNIDYLINYAGIYIYISKTGNILEVNVESIDVPIILGFQTDFSKFSSGKKIENNEKLCDSDLVKLDDVNSIISCLNENEFTYKVSSIDISNNEYTLAFDSEEKKAYLGDISDLNTKVLYLKEIMNKESGKKGEIFLNRDNNNKYIYFREGV